MKLDTWGTTTQLQTSQHGGGGPPTCQLDACTAFIGNEQEFPMFVVFFSNIHWGCPSPTFPIYEECTYIYIHILQLYYLYIYMTYVYICIYLLYICVIYIYIYRCRNPWHPRKIAVDPTCGLGAGLTHLRSHFRGASGVILLAARDHRRSYTPWLWKPVCEPV